jgi:hypothetical protein
MYINFLYTNQIVVTFILILSYNQEILHSLKTCFYLNNYKKIIHLKLFQIIIINKNNNKVEHKKSKRTKITKIFVTNFLIYLLINES